jgi:hypothetical protein
VQTHYGEQRVAVHYNSKKEITSVQLLDGIRNIDDQLILTILASFKNDGNSIVNYGNAFAAVSHPAMIGIPQQDQVSFKQAVVEAVLPVLNESVALYRMMSVTEHQHVIKISGLVHGSELVLNVYFNRQKTITKLHVEKGKSLIPDQTLEQLLHVLKKMKPR